MSEFPTFSRQWFRKYYILHSVKIFFQKAWNSTNAFHAMEETGGILEVGLTDIELRSEDFTDQNDYHLRRIQWKDVQGNGRCIGYKRFSNETDSDERTCRNDPQYTG